MYGYTPGFMNVTRNLVTGPGGSGGEISGAVGGAACAIPMRSWPAWAMNPEWTLSLVEWMIAWRAPSLSANTLVDGGVCGVTFGGSVAKVTVCPLTSRLSRSTVSAA